MDLSRDEEGATQDRSNAPITTTNDPEQVRWLIKKYCCGRESHLLSNYNIIDLVSYSD